MILSRELGMKKCVLLCALFSIEEVCCHCVFWLFQVMLCFCFPLKQYFILISLVQSLSHVWLFATPWTAASQASLSITNSRSSPKPNSPGQNTGVGSLSLLQGIFPTQGSSPGILHCRQILYQLSHKGSPKCVYTVPNIKININTITLCICNYLYLHKVPSHNLVHFNFTVRWFYRWENNTQW